MDYVVDKGEEMHRTKSEEQLLMSHLLQEYDKDIRPVLNTSSYTNLAIGMSLIRVMGLVRIPLTHLYFYVHADSLWALALTGQLSSYKEAAIWYLWERGGAEELAKKSLLPIFCQKKFASDL